MGYFFRLFYSFLLICDGIVNFICGLFGAKNYWSHLSENALMVYSINRVEKEIEDRKRIKSEQQEKALQVIRSELDKNG